MRTSNTLSVLSRHMPGAGHRKASVSTLPLKLKGLESGCRSLCGQRMRPCVSTAPQHGLMNPFLNHGLSGTSQMRAQGQLDKVRKSYGLEVRRLPLILSCLQGREGVLAFSHS